MKHKSIVILGVIVLAVVLFFTIGFSEPPEGVERSVITGRSSDGDSSDSALSDRVLVPVNKELSSFSFEGFGPGKSHLGTFSEYEVELVMGDGGFDGLKGIISVDSVGTDSERLDSHLKSEDFFDVAKYPEIEFVSTGINGEMMTGDLTFHGVTKRIDFPVEVAEDGISADFILSMKEFGIKYAAVNDEVVISFDFVK